MGCLYQMHDGAFDAGVKTADATREIVCCPCLSISSACLYVCGILSGFLGFLCPCWLP